ncbi:MAG TPA: alkaline phosphatase family protein [Actinomycetota bacterium]
MPSLPAGPGAVAGLPDFSRVVVIVMENKEYGSIVGSSSAPYENALIRRYGLASSAFAVSHPSLPNYLALIAGSTFGIRSDCTDCSIRATNLVDQLERAGISWKAYLGGMPSACFRGASAGEYAKKHDPLLYFRDVAGAASRCRRVVPLSRLGTDLRADRLPRFVWITPDLCQDTHDCGVTAGDEFLRAEVPPLLRALGPLGVLFVAWDEGTSNAGCCRLAAGGHVPLIVAGPAVRRGARLRAAVDHYSILRTIELAWGLTPLRGARCPCTRSLSGLLA